jgi:iron complex outermembrane receptor protein
VGANYRHNTLSSNIIAEFNREDRLGYFVQDEWKATEKLALVAGARYDLHTEINGTLSPRFAALYSPWTDHTFRAAFSMAYRPPTIFEASTDFNSIALPGLPPPFGSIVTPVRGSNEAGPEQIMSYEAGYQGWYFKHRVRLRADLFFNHISDLITFRTISPSLTTAVNGGEADIYGGEAGVEFLATRWLTGFANYSYQEIGQTFTGDARRSAPRYKFNAGLRGEWENGLSSEIALHHYGAASYPSGVAFTSFSQQGLIQAPNTRVGSYNLLNIRAAYRFWKDKAEMAVTAFNALNDRHREHPLGDTIGSRVMGWLTLKF